MGRGGFGARKDGVRPYARATLAPDVWRPEDCPVLRWAVISRKLPMGSNSHLGSGTTPHSTGAVHPRNRKRTDGHSAVRPFLKWAGGKRQLLPKLKEFYPEEFGTYHEPFLGSGAVFFDLANAEALQAGRVRLTDVNSDLVGCWLQLRHNCGQVVRHLRALRADYTAAPREHYYRVRDTFNPLRERITNGNGPRPERYTSRLTAMFIYLNRTGYNGLFRLNSSGGFNVPRGRYKDPKICDEENLRRVSSALSRLSAEIEHTSFEKVGRVAAPGDFVYFDPPYAPLSTTARFTSYTSNGFGREDQRALQQVVFKLVRKGCYVVLSNSKAPEITALYKDNSEAKNLNIKAHTVPARRAINSNASRRGHVDEYIITNVRRRPV